MTSPGQAGPSPLVLSPRGTLVGGGLAEDLADLIDRLLHEGRTRLIVDLTSVDAIDGAGVQALVEAQASAHRLGGFLRLAAPAPAVRDALVRAVPGAGLPVYETVADARTEPWAWRDVRLVLTTLGAAALLVALGLWWPGFRQTPRGRVPGASPSEVLGHAFTELLELAAAALIGFVVAAVARRLRRDQALQASMEQAQVLLCVSGAMMMIIIGDSLARAFGIVGAAGIVRFRTPVEDPKDVTILFLLMGLGMASGIGVLPIAGLGMLFLCAVLLVLNRSLARSRPAGMIVEVTAGGPRLPTAHVASAFARHGVTADLMAISPGPNAIVRYRVALPATVAPEDVDASLLADGHHGVSAVSWRVATDQ